MEVFLQIMNLIDWLSAVIEVVKGFPAKWQYIIILAILFLLFFKFDLNLSLKINNRLKKKEKLDNTDIKKIEPPLSSSKNKEF